MNINFVKRFLEITELGKSWNGVFVLTNELFMIIYIVIQLLDDVRYKLFKPISAILILLILSSYLFYIDYYKFIFLEAGALSILLASSLKSIKF